MKSEIKTYTYSNGEIQRVQIVEYDNWQDLDFFVPKTSPEALRNIARIYQDFFVKKAPYVFGNIYVFHIPDNYQLPFEFGEFKDKHISATNYLKRHFHSVKAKKLIQDLKDQGYLYLVKGKNPFIRSFVAYKDIGFISECEENAKLKVNSSFFTFDLFDCQSKYDTYATPLGLCVKQGKIINPPLFHRQALLVDNNNQVQIRKVELEELKINIPGKIYQRPDYRKTPKSPFYDLVIVADKIVAINKGGRTIIPSSGFVINTERNDYKVGDKVLYQGMENIIFGIQCGNSVIINNEKTLAFISKFYHFLSPGQVQYPPTNYPHDFNNDRAPRIALGESQDNKPLIIWFEGSSKMKYQKGTDSCGASLSEMADILAELNVKNAINLDGGGSAQILINNQRELKISDRSFKNNQESERPIPIGIIIR